MRFPGIADLNISLDGTLVRPWLAPGTSPETVQHLVLDQALPRILAHRGHLVLHAAGVAVDGRAVAFVGASGRGKSTLTASFDLAGYPALSDDGLVLGRDGDRVTAVATYPSLRLWPDAISALFTDRPPTTPMADYSAKRRLTGYSGARVANDPAPLACLFVLGDPLDDLAIEPVSPRDTAVAIISNAFQLDVTDKRRAADLLEAATGIAEHLPAFSLRYPRSFDRIAHVRAGILEHVASLAEPG